MEFEGNLTSAIVKRAEKQKKVSGFDGSAITNVCNFINYVNSLDDETVRVFDRSFDDVLIPAELKDLVLPNSVRLVAGDLRFTDLLVRPAAVPMKGIDGYVDYINNVDQMRGFFKKDSHSDMISLSSLRTDVSLTEVLDRISVGDKAKVVNQGSYPIPVKSVSDVIGNRYLSDTYNSVICDWLVVLKF